MSLTFERDGTVTVYNQHLPGGKASIQAGLSVEDRHARITELLAVGADEPDSFDYSDQP